MSRFEPPIAFTVPNSLMCSIYLLLVGALVTVAGYEWHLFQQGKVISVDLPTTIVRQVVYTENAARGDTSGKVMKPAKLRNGTEVKVADFCNIDDWIEIDTRDGSYKSRTQAPA